MKRRHLGLGLLALALAVLPWAWQALRLERAWAGVMALCGPV